MTQAQAKPETAEHLDAEVIIIGAGFAGTRALLEMRKRGRTAKVFDAASDVGGTWYWNKYPGARTDSEAWAYCYAMSEELQDDWVWPDRMPSQKHVQAYLSHVADRFDLRKDIQFNTQITGASYDEDSRSWEIATKDGERFRSRYLISAMGWLSVANRPDFPGEGTFSGEIYRSSSWPDHDVDFSNKRVGIIGSGSTAVQMLPIVARLADHVKLFQRTPNYVLPSRNRPLDEHDRASLAKEREENWSLVRQQVFAFPMVTSERVFDSVDDAERERIFEAGWEAGGFRFLFETFGDILVDERSNAAAADFIRRKIRAIVNDRKTAELLCPDYPFALKRPPLGSHYFEAFNRDNVELVDVSSQPIEKISETGLVAGGGHHDLDMIIFATGFDAVTGPMMAVDVKGRGGVSIRDKWAAGPQTYLGLMTDEFPNMFVMTGPQVPFANLPPIAEASAVWIADLMDVVSDQGGAAAEPCAEAVQEWVDTVNATLDATLLGGGAELRSWFMGANIPGKVQTPLFYFGGAGAFFDQLEHASKEGFRDIGIA